jgi:hypothetical protein
VERTSSQRVVTSGFDPFSDISNRRLLLRALVHRGWPLHLK